jgi:hypothetical protein
MDTTRARDIIAKGLGALWLLDGLLQLQPLMFGQTFVSNVLVPNLSDQPAWLHVVVTAGISLWDTNTVLANTGAALLQILIGVLLFFPLSGKAFKTGAWVSIVWGIVVWLCGEGAGALLTGNASFYTGAPGAVILYVFIAALLLMPEKVGTKKFPLVAGGTMALTALLQLQPAFWSADGASSAAMAYMMEPVHVLAAFPIMLAHALSLDPVVSNILLTLLPLLVGLSLIFKPNKITGTIALIFLALVWWVGQDFGGLSTLISGTPTDPQIAPLFALMLLPLFLPKIASEPMRD